MKNGWICHLPRMSWHYVGHGTSGRDGKSETIRKGITESTADLALLLLAWCLRNGRVFNCPKYEDNIDSSFSMIEKFFSQSIFLIAAAHTLLGEICVSVDVPVRKPLMSLQWNQTLCVCVWPSAFSYIRKFGETKKFIPFSFELHFSLDIYIYVHITCKPCIEGINVQKVSNNNKSGVQLGPVKWARKKVKLNFPGKSEKPKLHSIRPCWPWHSSFKYTFLGCLPIISSIYIILRVIIYTY